MTTVARPCHCTEAGVNGNLERGASSDHHHPLSSDTSAAIALAFLLGTATALGTSPVYHRFFKSFRRAEWIAPDLLRCK